MLERARTFNSDIVLIDLEDSVPPAEKAAARELAAEWVPNLSSDGRNVMVRVNSLETGLTRQEIDAIIGPELVGISIGKSESTWEIQEVDRIVSAAETRTGVEPGQIKLIPWIENASAVMAAQQMALASPRVIAIAFGAEDYTNDMGIERTDSGEEVAVPRAMVPIAARAAGVASLDSPFVRFRDPEALKQDCRVSRRLGYTGKFAIHPAQLETINDSFSPAPEEVAYARKAVESWQQAEAQGRGSVDLGGRMIDVPVFKRAQNLLALAEAVATRDSSR